MIRFTSCDTMTDPVDGVGLELARPICAARHQAETYPFFAPYLIAPGAGGTRPPSPGRHGSPCTGSPGGRGRGRRGRGRPSAPQVVALAGNVRADLHAVQPYARDLAQRGVRLLGCRRVDARADAPLLRRAPWRAGVFIRAGALPALAHELVDCGHATPTEGRWLSSHRGAGGQVAPTDRPRHRSRRAPERP